MLQSEQIKNNPLILRNAKESSNCINQHRQIRISDEKKQEFPIPTKEIKTSRDLGSLSNPHLKMGGVNKIVKVLLLLQQVVVPSVAEGTIYDGGLALLGALENTAMIWGMQCTSRSRNPPSEVTNTARSSNGTEDVDDFLGFEEGEATFPYCPEGYFCDLLIPGNVEVATADADEEVFGICRPCSGGPDTCTVDPFPVESDATPQNFLARTTLAECQNQCGVEQNTCRSTGECNLGTYCDFQDGDSGFCEECPPHLAVCSDIFDTGNLTEAGFDSCETACSAQCYPKSKLTVSVGGESGDEIFSDTLEDVNSIHFSLQRSVTGRVVDCGLSMSPCQGAEGAICLIERGVVTFVNKTINCFLGGGLAAVIYNTEQSCENFRGTFWDQDTDIPAVTLSHIDGRDLLEKAQSFAAESKSMMVTVEVGGKNIEPEKCELGCTKTNNRCDDIGLSCNWDMGEIGECEKFKGKACTDKGDGIAVLERLFCEDEGEFCDYASGATGHCNQCPENGALCFFSNLNKDAAMECSDRCSDGSSMELEAEPCKFCPKGSFTIADIGDAFSSTEEKAELVEPCQFCALNRNRSTCGIDDKWDMKYPYRT